VISENIYFKLSETEYISISTNATEEELYRYDDVMVSFYSKDKRYDLLDDYLIIALERFNFVLEAAVNKKLLLHDSIRQDIGYMWNEYLHKRGDFFYKEGQSGNSYWVGRDYKIWESSRDCNVSCCTWLYEKNGKFFFEITSDYPWHFSYPPSEKNKPPLSYNKFIKTYKPYVLREVSLEILQQWLKETERLLNIIIANDAIYLKDIFKKSDS
jgi:hypothetical protein